MREFKLLYQLLERAKNASKAKLKGTGYWFPAFSILTDIKFFGLIRKYFIFDIVYKKYMYKSDDPIIVAFDTPSPPFLQKFSNKKKTILFDSVVRPK